MDRPDEVPRMAYDLKFYDEIGRVCCDRGNVIVVTNGLDTLLVVFSSDDEHGEELDSFPYSEDNASEFNREMTRQALDAMIVHAMKRTEF
jgi:hypothetical protein